MLTVQSEIRPLLNKLRMDIDEIFRIALQYYKERLGVIWITMLTLQIGNPGNMGVLSCLGQGGLHSLSALVIYVHFAKCKLTEESL